MYRVVYTDQFIDNVAAHVAYLQSQQAGERTIIDWYERLFERLDALGIWPRANPIDESYSREVGGESHKVNFGDYLVFYQVDDSTKQVEVLAFMHGSTRK